MFVQELAVQASLPLATRRFDPGPFCGRFSLNAMPGPAAGARTGRRHMARTWVGLFHSLDDAHRAVQELTEAGLAAEGIGLIAPQDKASEVAAGAGAGILAGGAAGFLLTAVAFAIPGVGPVLAAGTMAGLGSLTGAGLGAVAGGLVGALVHHGVPEDLAPHYEEGVRRGGTVVTAQAEADRESVIAGIFQRNHAAEVETTGLSAEAMRRGREELAHLEPAGSEPLRFGDEGAKTQLNEDPISEVSPFQETRP